MKVLYITCIMIIICVQVMVAQKEKLQSGDSVRVALERETISKELILLRDSIQSSLISFDVRIKKASTSKSSKLTTAREELQGYQDQIRIDLEEVSQTSQNGWGAESLERLRTNMTVTRHHHKRICLKLNT